MTPNFASGCAGGHVLLVPYPAQGHMLPLLDLAHRFALSNLTITILVTPKNLPILTPLLKLHSNIETLILSFPSHPDIPAGIENGKDLPPSAFLTFILVFRQLYQPLLSWFKSHPSPPCTIISDFFLGWTQRLADEVGVRRIVFSPSGALALSVIYSLWRHMPDPPDEDHLEEEICFHDIPKCPKFPWWQVSPLYRTHSQFAGSSSEVESLKDEFKANLDSWGLIINTFEGLEGVYLENLKKTCGHGRVWAVGPLNILGRENHNEPISTLDADMAKFLDNSADDSVVYVAFGTQAVLKNDQMAALASGLEKSGVRFIWSVKQPTKGLMDGGYGVMPVGFEDRTAGRGLVVRGWAPQVPILSHRAVGAFLTHCGWNSVIESVVAGLPMLTWPMGADQFSDAKLLMNELKVGIRVCEGATTVPDSDELSRVLSYSVCRTSVFNVKDRVRKLQTEAHEAVKLDSGQSSKALDDLIKCVSEVKLQKMSAI